MYEYGRQPLSFFMEKTDISIESALQNIKDYAKHYKIRIPSSLKELQTNTVSYRSEIPSLSNRFIAQSIRDSPASGANIRGRLFNTEELNSLNQSPLEEKERSTREPSITSQHWPVS